MHIGRPEPKEVRSIPTPSPQDPQDRRRPPSGPAAACVWGRPHSHPRTSNFAGPAGDLTDDGSLTVTDGVNVLRCAADLSASHSDRADVDCNGAVSVTDGILTLRAAAGLQSLLPCFFFGMYSKGVSTTGLRTLGEFSAALMDYSGTTYFESYVPLLAPEAPRTSSFVYINYAQYAHDVLHKPVGDLTAAEIDAHTQQELTTPAITSNRHRIAGFYLYDEPDVNDVSFEQQAAAIEAVNRWLPGMPTFIEYIPFEGSSPPGLTYRGFTLYAKDDKNLDHVLNSRIPDELERLMAFN